MSNPPILLPDGSKCYSGPSCKLHGQHSDPQALFEINLKKLDTKLQPYAGYTPVQVDTFLSEIYSKYYAIAEQVERLKNSNEFSQKTIDSEHSYPHQRERLQKAIISNDEKIAKLEAEQETYLEQAAPAEEEYLRRGKWSRAFIVANGNGHVHKTRSCSTCYPTTRFGWLTDYSGADENKIVEDAGEKACTVCYPSAPVEVLNRPSRIKTEADVEREKRKNELAEKKAAAELKKIYNPDGTPLKLTGRWGETIKSERSAEIKLVDIATDFLQFEANPEYNRNPEYLAEQKADYKLLLTALSSKRAIPEAEIEASVKNKAKKKFKTYR